MLEVKELTINGRGGVVLLDDVSLSVSRGEALGITGESGAGKTTLLKAVLGLLDADQRILRGAVLADKQDLGKLSPARRREACGTVVGFIPQSPITAFDGRLTVGRQMEETLRLRLGLSKPEARALAMEKLEAVRLGDAQRVFDSRPGQLSGGMLQRVAVAMLLAMKPRYILADEPTSALDDDNRDSLLSLLGDQLDCAGLLLITHGPHALRALCRRVAVLSGGRIVEQQDTDSLFESPRQEWTREFARCAAGGGQGEFRWTEL